MKLAEALAERSDCQTKIEEIKKRLVRSARVKEGEQPVLRIQLSDLIPPRQKIPITSGWIQARMLSALLVWSGHQTGLEVATIYSSFGPPVGQPSIISVALLPCRASYTVPYRL